MNCRNLILVLVAACTTWTATPVSAEVNWIELNLSPFAGFPNLDETLAIEEQPVYGGRVGITLLKHFGLEGSYGTSETTEWRDNPAFNVRLDQLGADFMINFLPGYVVNPYAFVGWAQLNWVSAEWGPTLRLTGREFGGGLKVQIFRRSGFRVDLRLDVRDVIAANDVPLREPGENKANIFYTGGLHIALLDTEKDSDDDGVPDRFDNCRGTPLGALVDPFGCPLDRDEDGVPDGLDECPFTPFGALVDITGCPSDSDGDGVFDGLDRCSLTPSRARVDAAGCPIDSDGDGIYDGIDACPGTPVGVAVDEDGCPVPTSAQEVELLDTGTLRIENIYFETGSSELKPMSFPALDQVGEILIRWPQLEIEVAGHTDSQGSDEYNLVLSRNRAQSVFDYLAANFPGLRLGQFIVRGYGESQGIAGNETAAGRATNRRVEFRILNRGVLRK